MPGIIGRTRFVGRAAELRRLESAFDAAAGGHGGLALVVGEPGIGKTALCEQLAAHVTERGGQILAGHCYEDGSLSLPYLPFVEAIRTHALGCEPQALAEELGAGAADVARIVPELRVILQVEPGPPTDPQSDRYRLLQAVTALLRGFAAAQPLLLVLEDLHDADRGTLDLLVYLARHLAGTRLLVIGTYRDVEVDRTHPLSGTLAELRRVAPLERVRLSGLTLDETRQVVCAIAGEDAPHTVADAVYRQTEGNPLFVQEVSRYLVEEELTGGQPLVWGIPEGLRDVIGKRLSRLNPACNRLLAVAAVIGREFELDTLLTVAGEAEDAVIDALDEAVGVGMLEERERTGAASYRFVHALFRQTLYEELRAPRRIRLHQQVARALEERNATRLDDHAAELAEHFAHSSDPDDLAKAVDYGQRAARRAMAVFAYGEAARLLQRALEVQEVLDSDDALKRCDLLLELGEALNHAGAPRRVLDEVAPDALTLAEKAGDHDRAGRVCRLALNAINNFGGGGLGYGTPEGARWAELFDRYTAAGTRLRALADTFLSGTRTYSGRFREGRMLAGRARELILARGGPASMWDASVVWLSAAGSAQAAAERVAIVHDLDQCSRERVATFTLTTGLFFMFGVFLEHGLRERAEAIAREMLERAERTQQLNLRLIAMMPDGAFATLDGQLEEAMAVSDRILAQGEAWELSSFAWIPAYSAGWLALLLLGKPEVALAMPGLSQATTLPVALEAKVLPLATAGYTREVSELLDEHVVGRTGIDTGEDEWPVRLDIQLLQAAVLVRHEPALRLLHDRYAAIPTVLPELGPPICIPRVLGDAAVLLGKRGEARIHYERALAEMERMRYRPEIALTRLGMADLLLSGTPAERVAATAHLDFAIGELEAMKMQPALTRAIALRDSSGPEQSGATRVTFPDGLSAREVEVLRLLATGKSNPEIAEALVISLNTVYHHVGHIFDKIGVANRVEAATYAQRHGLV